jgi:signal peptidase I
MSEETGRVESAELENKIEEEQTETQKLSKKIKKAEKSVKHYQFFLLRLVLFIVIVWILFFKIIGLTPMPSADMYPRVDAGDLVMFYRLDKDVKAQDIIVIEKQTPDSGNEKQMFISRVIAAPGDEIEITETGNVIVNGNAMIESNIFYQTFAYTDYTSFPVKLGEDECFVLGDNRDGATDSRYFGPVKKDEIKGSVITIIRRNNL